MNPFRYIAAMVAALLLTLPLSAGTSNTDMPMLDESGEPSEALVEALLYPGEHDDVRFTYTSEGPEAQFCLDASLSASKPFAQVYPERIEWPAIGGVPMQVASLNLKLIPRSDDVTDAELDRGFAIRWHLRAVGQDFAAEPIFRLQAVGAEVFSTASAKILFQWEKPAPPRVCTDQPEDGFPQCDLPGISIESQAVAVSPVGDLAAVATSGLKPGIHVYRITETPTRIWQALFPAQSGGASDVAFSADGRYVVALLGNGAIHRFDARQGGRHLAIPSRGLTARTVPPGDIVAVGGNSGELVFWRLSDGTIEWRLDAKNFRGDIDEIAVSGNGETVATLEYTETHTIVRLWEIGGKRQGIQFDLPGTSFEKMVLNHNGSALYFSHSQMGLVTLPAKRNGRIEKVSEASTRCRGALFWATEQSGPACAITGGILKLTATGEVTGTLRIHSDAAQWNVAMAPTGTTVAVGAGHLLLWR